MGWTGKLLRVDLSAGKSSIEEIPRDWLRDYVGGRGLADRYLYEEMDPTVDPLSPENVLIFATGPLTGTPVPCGARYMVVTKGALTGAITTSNSGGHWGPELKFAGYDLLILEGRAPTPSYLFIYDDQVEVRDASHLWGKSSLVVTPCATHPRAMLPDAINASGPYLVKIRKIRGATKSAKQTNPPSQCTARTLIPPCPKSSTMAVK